MASDSDRDENVSQENGKGLARVFEILASLPADFLPKGRQDAPPQKREDFDHT
jgi:hypothetical protein